MKSVIFDVARASFVDGPGIRTTVFFKGCNLRCAWCHNPESQSPKAELLFYRNKCTGCGKCREKCPHNLESCDLCGKCALYCPRDARDLCGKEYTVDEILELLLKDRTFYESSGGGVTFSGGECMLQADFLEAVLRECKKNGIHTAVDTAGHVPFEKFEQVLPYTDLFLYDVKCLDSDRHRQYTGVGNELILKNLEALLQKGKSVWVRIPIIPSVNDTEEEMKRIKAMLDSFGGVEKIELLPYHALGEHKYAAIGRKAQTFSVPNEDLMKRLKAIF